MDKRIETILAELTTTLGLQQFVLRSYELTKELSAFGGFDILLSADWLPPVSDAIEEDDLLPEGAVSVIYSLRFNQLRYAGAVGRISVANPITSDNNKEEYFLNWLEQQTGRLSEKNFRLTNRTEERVEGRFVLDGTPVSTEGYFDLQWDIEGRLLVAILPVMATESVVTEPFSLTLEAIEPLVRQQFTPVRLPLEDEERFADYYAIDEVYITQEGTVLPFFNEEQAAFYPRAILKWNSSLPQHFEREVIQPYPELSVDEAFKALEEPHQKVSDEVITSCSQSVTRFLSSELPEESSEWELYRVLEQPGYIEIVCRRIGEVAGPLRRKIVFMLDPHTYDVINFLDSNEMAQLFEGFTQPLVATVTQEQAFDQMLSYITLQPTYVYDQKNDCYTLCGLLDAEECIDAVTGELKQLNDL